MPVITLLPPVPDPEVERIEIQLLGPRNMPVAKARIPKDLLLDVEAAFRAFQNVSPEYTWEQFLRYIFSKGLNSARVAVQRGNISPPRQKTFTGA